MALCSIEPELLPIEVLHCDMIFLRQGFRKLSSDRQAHTHTSKIIYHLLTKALTQEVKNLHKNIKHFRHITFFSLGFGFTQYTPSKDKSDELQAPNFLK